MRSRRRGVDTTASRKPTWPRKNLTIAAGDLALLVSGEEGRTEWRWSSRKLVAWQTRYQLGIGYDDSEDEDESELVDTDGNFGLRTSRAASWRGTHAVAERSFRVGEKVLVEEPLVTTRDEVLPGLPTDAPEWVLVHALLCRGHGREWAMSYARGEGGASDGGEGGGEGGSSADDEDEDDGTKVIAAWLRETHALSKADDDLPQLLHSAVRHNAFGLETPLLAVEYGAACYARACRLNHSCDANCVSIRLGANMAIYACAPIEAGDELTHSYLPPRLLILPKLMRAPHLPFEVCMCRRCQAEKDEPPPHVAACLLPPEAAHLEMLFAQFKMAALGAAGSGGAAARELLDVGDAILVDATGVPAVLSARPIVALDVCLPLIAAHWTARACGELAEADAEEPYVTASCVPRAADLALAAAERLEAVGAAPATALELLKHTCAISAYLLGTRDEEEMQSAVVSAGGALGRLLGGGIDWMRDDVPWVEEERRSELQRGLLRGCGRRASLW